MSWQTIPFLHPSTQISSKRILSCLYLSRFLKQDHLLTNKRNLGNDKKHKIASFNEKFTAHDVEIFRTLFVFVFFSSLFDWFLGFPICWLWLLLHKISLSSPLFSFSPSLVPLAQKSGVENYLEWKREIKFRATIELEREWESHPSSLSFTPHKFNAISRLKFRIKISH